MSTSALDSLPDDARTWAFGIEPPLDTAPAARLLDRLGRFLETWTAHRQELRAGVDLRHGRFLFVAVDETRTGASGCSIDALLRELGELETELRVRITDAAPVWFRDGEGTIHAVERAEFRRRAERGEVDAETIVYDLTLTRLGDVREGLWEVPAGRAWHARLLHRGARSGSAGAAG